MAKSKEIGTTVVNVASPGSVVGMQCGSFSGSVTVTGVDVSIQQPNDPADTGRDHVSDPDD